MPVKGSVRYSGATAVLIIVFTVFSVSLSSGQDLQRDKPLLKDRMFYGGSFSLQLGTITNIEVSPVVGIWLLPRVSVAAGPSYQFYKDPFDRTDIYGLRIYTQYVVIQDINKFIPVGINMALFFHAEYEGLSLKRDFWMGSSFSTGRFPVHTLLGGAGISQPIGRRSSVNFIVLWALTSDDYGIYSNPEFCVGFNF